MKQSQISEGASASGDLKAIWLSLTEEAAAVLNDSVVEARRRNHMQTTPVHVAAAVLSQPSGLLSLAAGVNPQPDALLKLQWRRLELFFDAALGRMLTCEAPLKHEIDPPISKSLKAALIRAHTRRRRQHQQSPGAVRIKLEELILSVLDDPAVIRVLSESGFRTALIKAIIERSLGSSAKFKPDYSSAAAPDSSKQRSQLGKVAQQEHRISVEVNRAVNILLRSRNRNPVLIGGSESGMIVKELLRRLEVKEIEYEMLKNVQVIHLEKSFPHEGSSRVHYLDHIIKALGGNLYPDGVIIHLGDLLWLLEDPVDLAVRTQAEADILSAEVDGVGAGLRWLQQGICGQIWLIGTATRETYMRCQVRHPNIEDAWDLHAILPTDCEFSLSGMPSGLRCQEPMAKRRHHKVRGESVVDISKGKKHIGLINPSEPWWVANGLFSKRLETKETADVMLEDPYRIFLEKKCTDKKQMSSSKMMNLEGAVHTRFGNGDLQMGPWYILRANLAFAGFIFYVREYDTVL